MSKVNRFKDANSVAQNVASELIAKLNSLLSEKDEVHLMLTGGTVGIASLSALGSHPERDSVDYSRVHFWWGDERYVAADHEEMPCSRNLHSTQLKFTSFLLPIQGSHLTRRHKNLQGK